MPFIPSKVPLARVFLVLHMLHVVLRTKMFLLHDLHTPKPSTTAFPQRFVPFCKFEQKLANLNRN